MAPSPDAVADAADMLVACLQAAEAVLPSRDQTGTGMITGGSTESAPPWNSAAASALFIPWAGVRALENQVRAMLGLGPVARGGSAANTRAALRALPALAGALPEEAAVRVAGKLEAWCGLALALPAVDRPPQWTVIDVPGGMPDCPYCGLASLREHRALGIVACLYPNCPPARDGHRPYARVFRHEGRACWRWLDGTIQPWIGPLGPARESR